MLGLITLWSYNLSHKQDTPEIAEFHNIASQIKKRSDRTPPCQL